MASKRRRADKRQTAFKERTMRDWEQATSVDGVTVYRRAKKRQAADDRLRRMLMDEGE
jgi:hypothetical protein